MCLMYEAGWLGFDAVDEAVAQSQTQMNDSRMRVNELQSGACDKDQYS